MISSVSYLEALRGSGMNLRQTPYSNTLAGSAEALLEISPCIVSRRQRLLIEEYEMPLHIGRREDP
jgi:hypothetical protein